MRQIRVTPKQNEYLKKLDTGPKTTRDFGASMASAAKMLIKLRNEGLVKATQAEQKNKLIYTLTKPYSELVKEGLTVIEREDGRIIPPEEVLYAAILRNAGMTGRRLRDQYRKQYSRTGGGISNIVSKARKEGLCR